MEGVREGGREGGRERLCSASDTSYSRPVSGNSAVPVWRSHSETDIIWAATL